MSPAEEQKTSAEAGDAENRRALEHGSSNATADYAVEGRPAAEDRFIDAPHARRVQPLAPGEKPDQLAAKVAETKALEEAQEDREADDVAGGRDPQD